MNSIPLTPTPVKSSSYSTHAADRIELIEIERINDRSAIKAVCVVRIDRLIINDVKVIAPRLASRAFVAMPTRKFGDEWRPLVQISDADLLQAVNDAVLSAWRGAR